MSVIKSVYNRVLRPVLPRKVAVYNGVPVRNVRLFDATDEFPTYEKPLIEALRRYVTPGDTVVIIGGGLGVSTVVAAEQAGQNGHVETFEASADLVSRIHETLSLNRMADRATVHHALVGEAIDVEGELGDIDPTPATELPSADVFVMDCEGAERTILRDREFTAPILVVETHAFLDSPEPDVRELLTEQGYEIIDRGVEEEERGVYVLTARKEGS